MHLEPNPQSAGFVWQDKSVSSDLLDQAHLDQWNQEGYLLLKGVLPRELVAEVEQVIDPFIDPLKQKVTPLGYQCAEAPEEAVPVQAEPGDIVVFSSLTPHRTDPNLTKDIRKSYIVQYAHEGAKVVSTHGTRTPQQDPERQYPVLQDGKPVSNPA
ncbi:MAG: hypothetical protein ACI82A_001769 [Candidatus Azotimanducaceae bacterium]|jgi:hypothetical protein